MRPLLSNKSKKVKEGMTKELRSPKWVLTRAEMNDPSIQSVAGPKEEGGGFPRSSSSYSAPPPPPLSRTFRADEIISLAQVLRTNTSIVSLDLSALLASGQCVSEVVTALAEALRVNRSVRSLVLEGHFLGDDGASHLADALRLNTSLRNLSLRRCGLGNRTVTEIALALERNSGLRDLDLRGNFLRSGGVRALRDALETNETLVTCRVDGEDNMVVESESVVSVPGDEEWLRKSRSVCESSRRGINVPFSKRIGKLRTTHKEENGKATAEWLSMSKTVHESARRSVSLPFSGRKRQGSKLSNFLGQNEGQTPSKMMQSVACDGTLPTIPDDLSLY